VCTRQKFNSRGKIAFGNRELLLFIDVYCVKYMYVVVVVLWSLQMQRGTKAPQAAGRIHTDFEKGFIMAEVMKYDDFKAEGSEAAVKVFTINHSTVCFSILFVFFFPHLYLIVYKLSIHCIVYCCLCVCAIWSYDHKIE